MIEGLKVTPLQVFEDDRGALFEVIHTYDLPGGRYERTELRSGLRGELVDARERLFPGKFGQVYVVSDPVRGTVRAFHKHKVLVDYFCIVSGAAKFVFVDDSQDTFKETGVAKPGNTQIVVASGERPVLITVPPGVYHGWVSLTDNTTLLSIASELYDKQSPDEVRVPPNSFDAEFGENPWMVKGR